MACVKKSAKELREGKSTSHELIETGIVIALSIRIKIADRRRNYSRCIDLMARICFNILELKLQTGTGLRNARLNFRQQEENHIMENVIFNELMAREYDVDVGVVEYSGIDENGKKSRKQLEVDFVANKGSKRYYIQSVLTIDDESKRKQETASLLRVADSFKKIVVVKDDIIPWHDDTGILYVGIEQFLLEESAIDI